MFLHNYLYNFCIVFSIYLWGLFSSILSIWELIVEYLIAVYFTREMSKRHNVMKHEYIVQFYLMRKDFIQMRMSGCTLYAGIVLHILLNFAPISARKRIINQFNSNHKFQFVLSEKCIYLCCKFVHSQFTFNYFIGEFTTNCFVWLGNR